MKRRPLDSLERLMLLLAAAYAGMLVYDSLAHHVHRLDVGLDAGFLTGSLLYLFLWGGA